MAEERITVQIVRKKVSKMEFFLNKEDRKIKKIVKKEEKIRLTKEDLKELRKQIEEYGVKEEKTVLALARLQQEDSKYLDTILKKYYKDREMKPISDEEAILQLDLVSTDFYVYRNRSNRLAVIYRRKDGREE